MNEHDLKMYRRMITERDAALREAHDALRLDAAWNTINAARTAIEAVLPDLQQ